MKRNFLGGSGSSRKLPSLSVVGARSQCPFAFLSPRRRHSAFSCKHRHSPARPPMPASDRRAGALKSRWSSTWGKEFFRGLRGTLWAGLSSQKAFSGQRIASAPRRRTRRRPPIVGSIRRPRQPRHFFLDARVRRSRKNRRRSREAKTKSCSTVGIRRGLRHLKAIGSGLPAP